MLGVGDAMKSAISRKTVCPNESNRILEEDPNKILIATVTTAKEAAAGIQDIRDEVR